MKDIKNKKIAIYGGTFDPIHLGHLLTGSVVIKTLGYDLIIFVPANIPVHKDFTETAGAQKRLTMVEIAIEGQTHFDVLDVEIQRGGRSYTIDTVRQLVKEYDLKNKIGIIFGDDLLDELNTWKEIEELNKKCELICLKRNKKAIPKTPYNVKFVDNNRINISSSEIRKKIKNGLSIGNMVAPKVEKYIIDNKLYRM